MLLIWMIVLHLSPILRNNKHLIPQVAMLMYFCPFQRLDPVTSVLLTLVTTARIAIPCMMGCHAPMSWAFSGTMRRYWVVIFHASTRISNILFTRANRGASGKEATNKVTKPNWITVNEMDTHHGWWRDGKTTANNKLTPKENRHLWH